jgi:serine/threonine protein kinase
MINRSSLTPSNFNQLVREIKIQSFLAHPNVVKLYHSFIDKEFVYLFLEPCLDGDLFATCKRKGRLSEKEAREVVKQVCSAVEYMHKHDIIHRDLKPENILLHEGVAKICDFGWAVYSPLLRDTRCGTPVYASPEMIKKELYDSKIDIWNIGVLTYELLFGNIPFEIKQVDDINKIVTLPPRRSTTRSTSPRAPTPPTPPSPSSSAASARTPSSATASARPSSTTSSEGRLRRSSG